MSTLLDQSHVPTLSSWVQSASDDATDFPIQNLPLGCVRARDGSAHAAIAIGDSLLDLSATAARGLLDARIAALVDQCRSAEGLNPLLGAGPGALRSLRAQVSQLLRDDTNEGARARSYGAELLHRLTESELLVPARIGDYTDFYASIDHATNVGTMFRPDNALLPNYKWVPIGYHGRASSIVPSGTSVRRPAGQTREDATKPPAFGPTTRLDYELEIGAFIGKGNPTGRPIPVGDAEAHVAGLCLVNDWSARDIQSWEYQPLGPFLAKSFATTVSPWIVTLDALAPFRVRSAARADGDPSPLPYLQAAPDASDDAFDIMLEVFLTTRRMRDARMPPHRLSRGNFSSMYWSLRQLVAHHTSNGCNLRPGDLIASGTVSGKTKESRGCLLELSWRGTEPLALPSNEERRFLEDGDEVVMRGYCERPGFRRIGFGECRGQVSAA